MKLDLSLNEYQAAINKAARGCGFSAGIADELTAAVTWLETQGLSTAKAALTALDTGPKATVMGQVGPSILTASHCYSIGDGPCFFEHVAAANREVRGLLTNVDAPLLMLGYAGIAAQQYGITSELQFGGGALALVDAADLNLKGEVPDQPGDLLLICEIEEQLGADQIRPPRLSVSKDLWDAINTHAAKTYVPATEASRLKGAGEGTTDGLTDKD